MNFEPFQVILAIASLIAVASAVGPAPVHPEEFAAPVYNYNYAVADDYSGAQFGQSENRDGYATSGEYHVALPDGRIQTVTYRVDDAYGGYVADVQYSGEPKYAPHKPAPHPAPHHPVHPGHPVHPVHAPVFHAAPVFHG